MSSRLPVIACSAIGAFAVLAATAAGASAAPVHHAAPAAAHHTNSSPRHTPSVNLRGATHDLTSEINRLTQMQAGVSTDSGISSSDAPALTTALGADLAAVKADLASLAGATTRSQVHAIVAAAHTAGELAAGQYVIATAAGSVESQVATASAGQQTLSDQVAAAAANGADVTTENGQLTDLGSQLTTASGAVTAALNTALTVAPTAARSDVVAAFSSAQQDLGNANTALSAAGADATSISAELAALPAPSPAPSPTPTA